MAETIATQARVKGAGLTVERLHTSPGVHPSTSRRTITSRCFGGSPSADELQGTLDRLIAATQLRHPQIGDLARSDELYAGSAGPAFNAMLRAEAAKSAAATSPATSPAAAAAGPLAAKAPHHPPKARRVIYLMQTGAPTHVDLFDYKPQLGALFNEELPDSVRGGQRLTGMTANRSGTSASAVGAVPTDVTRPPPPRSRGRPRHPWRRRSA